MSHRMSQLCNIPDFIESQPKTSTPGMELGEDKLGRLMSVAVEGWTVTILNPLRRSMEVHCVATHLGNHCEERAVEEVSPGESITFGPVRDVYYVACGITK